MGTQLFVMYCPGPTPVAAKAQSLQLLERLASKYIAAQTEVTDLPANRQEQNRGCAANPWRKSCLDLPEAVRVLV
jgi:hypothetical protein